MGQPDFNQTIWIIKRIRFFITNHMEVGDNQAARVDNRAGSPPNRNPILIEHPNLYNRLDHVVHR